MLPLRKQILLNAFYNLGISLYHSHFTIKETKLNAFYHLGIRFYQPQITIKETVCTNSMLPLNILFVLNGFYHLGISLH